jgi:hypothetical protein
LVIFDTDSTTFFFFNLLYSCLFYWIAMLDVLIFLIHCLFFNFKFDNSFSVFVNLFETSSNLAFMTWISDVFSISFISEETEKNVVKLVTGLIFGKQNSSAWKIQG